MDACVLQLDVSVFRVVEFRVSASGDVQPVHLGRERVPLAESIQRTGRIGGRALLSALDAANRLVTLARAAGKNAHVVVIASETVASARSADRFFAALKRQIGAGPRIVVPPGVLGRPSERAGLVPACPSPQVLT